MLTTVWPLEELEGVKDTLPKSWRVSYQESGLKKEDF